LLRAIPALDAIKVENSDQKTGVDIVRKAIQAPARQIVDNAGADGAVVIGKLLEAKEYNYGYDAQTGEYGDLVKLGIIDPTKVVRTALQDAASIADRHHGSDDHRTSEEGSSGHAWRRYGRHGRHGLLKNATRAKTRR
jgi:chaperonin GroEL (HSP60 family)